MGDRREEMSGNRTSDPALDISPKTKVSQHLLDQDDFVILVDTILVDPVRVQHPQVSTSTTDTFFSGSSETSLEFEVVDTLSNGFTVGCSCEIRRGGRREERRRDISFGCMKTSR